MKAKILIGAVLGSILLGVGVLWFLFRTGGDYAIPLSGNFSLVRVYSGATLIAHVTQGVVVDANVDGYAIVGSLVVGHSSAAELQPERDLSKPGYFVLDTESRSVKQGSEKQAWLAQLHELGVSTEPALKVPARTDSGYRP